MQFYFYFTPFKELRLKEIILQADDSCEKKFYNGGENLLLLKIYVELLQRWQLTTGAELMHLRVNKHYWWYKCLSWEF